MKRRSFLKYSSLISAPVFLGGLPVSALNRNRLMNLIDESNDKVLVLIQLNGGNDGLNTIIPLEFYDELAHVRSNIIIPEQEVLKIEDHTGLHPEMSGIRDLYDNGKINIIQSVGYPGQNRSHFRSNDIWHSASDSNDFISTGWIGRYLDELYPGYPEAYPTPDLPDPFAITMGNVVSETCQGISGNFSMNVANPNNISQLSSPVKNKVVTGCAADLLSYVVDAIEKTNVYGERIREAYENGNNQSSLYDLNINLSSQLKTIARLISGGLQSKVYIAKIGGFDTHANQVMEGDPTKGEHAVLLSNLSDSIAAFQDDLHKLGIEDRVIGMTYSEFGRRIRSNNSLGTDHGDAVPLIVFGSCVYPGLTGINPAIDPEVAQKVAVPMQFDFRSVYGSLLIDWFDIEEGMIDHLFPHDFTYIPMTTACSTTTTQEFGLKKEFKARVFPNPTKNFSNLELEIESDWIKVNLFNSVGQRIKVVCNQRFSAGQHKIPIDLTLLPFGVYTIQVQSGKNQKSLRLIKS